MSDPLPSSPIKLCECGCGEPAPVAKRDQPWSGRKKGEAARFISGHNGRIRKREGCEALDCIGQHFAAGLCNKHYIRMRRHGNLTGKYPQGPATERFWRHVDRTEDCWNWTGALWGGGYGSFTGVDGASISAHRFSYQLHIGAIPDGHVVCHRCDNPTCVRPEHLFLGTQLDNVRDMFSKGRNVSGYGRRTHCKNGHAFDEANTQILPDGSRRCRACRRLNYAKRAAKKRGA